LSPFFEDLGRQLRFLLHEELRPLPELEAVTPIGAILGDESRDAACDIIILGVKSLIRQNVRLRKKIKSVRNHLLPLVHLCRET